MVSAARLRLASLAVALLMHAAPAGATAPDTIGMGSRSTALGGAVGAGVSDFSANFYNPAGLVRDGDLQISLGYMRLGSSLQINGVDSDLEPIGSLSLGLVAPGEIGGIRFGFSLAVMLNDQRLSRTRTAVTNRPRWELYDTRAHKIYLGVNFAVRPVEWLLIGGGMTFQAPSEIAMGLRGDLELVASTGSELEHQLGGDLLALRYPVVGAQFIPHERFSFGATYRGSYQLDGALNVDAGVILQTLGMDAALLELSVISYSVNTYGPQQLALSTLFEPNDRLSVAFDLTWMDWSKHPSLIPLDEIALDLTTYIPIGITVPGEILGKQPIPMNMSDRWVPRLGVEYLAFENEDYELRVRGGFVYERSPFPRQTGALNFMDSDRYSFSVGAGFDMVGLEPTLDGRVRFDFHFLYAYLPERAHTKDSLVDPVGDLLAGGHQFGGGMQVEVHFE